MKTSQYWRHALILAVMLGSAVFLLLLGPLSQNLQYHAFADKRTLLSIPNALDVLSNLIFTAVGLQGMWLCYRQQIGAGKWAWISVFACVALVSLGSGHYHLAPNNATLLWDRLPIAMGVMALLVAVATEVIHVRLLGCLPLALFVGAASVVYWHYSDDLRLYAWVQFVGLLLVLLILLLFRSRYSHAWLIPAGLGWYVVAKIAEWYDAQVYAMGMLISGHTLKHLLAGVGLWCLVLMLRWRRERS